MGVDDVLPLLKLLRVIPGLDERPLRQDRLDRCHRLSHLDKPLGGWVYFAHPFVRPSLRDEAIPLLEQNVPKFVQVVEGL